MKISASPMPWHSWRRISIALVLCCGGCDASKPSAPNSGAPNVPIGASQQNPPSVPESLRPIVAELEELAKRKTEIPANTVPYLMPTFGRPYLIAAGGKLTMIDLSYTPVTDAFLKKLQDLPALEAINLDGTQITDEGLKNLGSQPALKLVYVRGTQISDEGAASFRESHPECKVTGLESSN